MTPHDFATLLYAIERVRRTAKIAAWLAGFAALSWLLLVIMVAIDVLALRA